MVTPQYWAMSQAIACIRTGSEAVADSVLKPQSVDTLCREILKSNPGQRWSNRIFSNRPPSLSSEPVPAGKSPGGALIVDFLTKAHVMGLLWCEGRPAGSPEWVNIGSGEAQDLEFRICPGDLEHPFGYWTESGECRFLQMRYRRDQILRLVQPTPQRPTQLTADRIYDRLMKIMADCAVKKDEAFKLCKSVPGFSRNGFKIAWHRLPSDLKVGRGKHGPRRLKH